MKLSDYLVEFLIDQGVDTVFGYQGGAITHLINSIYKYDKIKFVETYHEQAAAFAAEAYSRVSGNIGVAIATSGPGATNLITGIGSSYFDSIPCLYITGQVNLNEFKKNDKLRQNGFQETDIVNVVRPITKYAKMITNKGEIKYELEKAIYIAKEGRPGSVLIDIPMNIQRSEVDCKKLASYFYSDEYKNKKVKNKVNINIVKKIMGVLSESKRPVILLGGGIRLAKACDELMKFSKLADLPVVSTMMGLDGLNHDFENYVGFMGAYGNRFSNMSVANSDCLIVLGSRLTSRQTSTIYDSFAREAKIIHIDIDENELNKNVKEYMSINCDLKFALNEIINYMVNNELKFDHSEWRLKIKGYKSKFPSYPTQKHDDFLDPNEFMHMLSKELDNNAIISLDVGQNQVWACQSIDLKKGQRMITSGGMGSMGFSLPASVGAYFAKKDSQIIVISGDGGFQMNIQELQTIVREKIPIKIIIMNNKSLGMIRHFQEMYFDSRYYGTIEGYSVPNFLKIAKAYGIIGYSISDYDDMNKLGIYLNSKESCLINVDLDSKTYVIPKLAMGRPIEDQSPLIDRKLFKNQMIVGIYKDKNAD